MHIPQGPTATLALELFDDALAAALRPSPDYDVSRWLYVPNHYSEYRYILGTRGRKPLICMGINPSTAAPDALDPTLQSAQRIALSNGYDSFLMFNVYAQRATRPDDMERSCNPVLHAENRRAFRYLLSVPGPRPVGRLGEHHREAGVSDGLYAGLCRRRQRRRGRVVHRRPPAEIRPPPPPPVSQGGHEAAGLRHRQISAGPGNLNRCEAQSRPPPNGGGLLFFCVTATFSS